MSKKIIIAAGGTGGHLYPAQALARQLALVEPKVAVHFLGGGLSRNFFFDRIFHAFDEVDCACPSSGSPWNRLKAAVKILRGTWQALRFMRRWKPDLVVGFGSYHSLPVLAAAYLLRIPMVLHDGNAIPGRVIRLFSRYAKLTGIQMPAAARFLKGRSLQVGVPLREGYTHLFGSREKAREYFHLDPKCFTLLVFGGSQGALGVNSLFSVAAAYHLAERTQKFQVIHISGDVSLNDDLENLYDEQGIRACVKGFETHMDRAWLAADLVVSRAGAGTIAEQIEFEIPGILLPFPYASDQHQEENARFMEETVQGAVHMPERKVNAQMLSDLLMDLVGEDQKKLKAMRENIRRYKTESLGKDLCSVVQEVMELQR